MQTEGNCSVTYLPKSYRGKQILRHQIASTGSLRSLLYVYSVLAKWINIDISKNKRSSVSQAFNITSSNSMWFLHFFDKHQSNLVYFNSLIAIFEYYQNFQLCLCWCKVRATWLYRCCSIMPRQSPMNYTGNTLATSCKAFRKGACKQICSAVFKAESIYSPALAISPWQLLYNSCHIIYNFAVKKIK